VTEEDWETARGRDNDQVMGKGTPGDIGVGRVMDHPCCLKLVPEAAPVRIEKK